MNAKKLFAAGVRRAAVRLSERLRRTLMKLCRYRQVLQYSPGSAEDCVSEVIIRSVVVCNRWLKQLFTDLRKDDERQRQTDDSLKITIGPGD